MSETLNPVNPLRADFSKIRTGIAIPNLIEVQKRSYERFLQMRTAPADRENAGLQAVFKSIFPISDFRQTCSLEFVDYTIGNWECKCGELVGIEHLRSECTHCGRRLIAPDACGGEVLCDNCGNLTPVQIKDCEECGDPVALKFKYDVDECQERGQTFTVPLKVTIQLVVYDKDPDTEVRSIRDIKEQEVYFGEIPMLTENGTFIINGTERVIVSQLHRSPGVFYQSDTQKTAFMAKVIPYRGSWVEFEYDQKNVLYVRIDRKRKFPATVFLRALGLEDDASILRAFYTAATVKLDAGKFVVKADAGAVGKKIRQSVTHPKSSDEILKKGRKVRPEQLDELRKAKVDWIPVEAGEMEGAATIRDLADPATGEVLVEVGSPLTAEALDKLHAAKVETFDVCFPETEDVGG